MLFLWKAIFPQSSTNRQQERSTFFKELTGTALKLIWRAPIVFMLNKRQWTVKLVWTLIHSGSHLSSYLIRALKYSSKIAKHWKNHLPWVKSTLKKLIRKRDKYFRIKNKLHKSRDIQHHKSLRREVREGFASLTGLMLSVSSVMEIERNNPYLVNASGLSLRIPVLTRWEC